MIKISTVIVFEFCCDTCPNRISIPLESSNDEYELAHWILVPESWTCYNKGSKDNKLAMIIAMEGRINNSIIYNDGKHFVSCPDCSAIKDILE